MWILYYLIPFSVAVNEEADKDELRVQIEREQFVRAATLAASCGISEQEVRDLRLKALWQMSVEYRNARGAKSLAQEYGLSKQEVREFLERHAQDKRNEGKSKPLEPCYDIETGDYLSFEEWMERFLKNWDKLSVP